MTDVRRAHEENARESVRTACPDVPASLAAVIDRALDPHAGRRPQRADELADALVALNASLHARIRQYGSAAAVIAVLAVLAVGMVVRQRDTELPPANGVAAATAPVPVIAVLRFENLGTGTDSEEFAADYRPAMRRMMEVEKPLSDAMLASRAWFNPLRDYVESLFASRT